MKISDKPYYRVVTEDMKSLGLRRNPNIVQYKLGWIHELKNENIVPGKGDFGGFWVCGKLSSAKALKKYMLKKHNVKTRVFESRIGMVLYENSYRTKTDSISLIKEVEL